ncbi:unnamed protein product [Enterobius vermicularis]|uniref:Homeobox domain-containing protein n=1 Tax=Enterobius vermicularis TaxID=51028 RepID=A0A0N4VRH5_ENTVE|nr:unnamed protein product [Enterobius vermicularis]
MIYNASFLADPSTRLETNGDGELIPQRRERYVFRPILIRILESFFAQTPFPDLNRRIEIATACNQALQIDKKGVGLTPKEVVSPQVVANWFANKRKEIRRRSNEEGAEANAANVNSQMSSSDVPLTPSPSASNTPMECERSGDERAITASVPLSALAAQSDGSPSESNSAPPSVSTANDDGNNSISADLGEAPEVSSPDQCLADIQSQLEIVNNSVLALVNPYSNSIHQSVIKMEQTAK